MKKYCKICGIVIKTGLLAGFGESGGIEFEDGTLCQACAEIRVKDKRGKQ